LFIPGPEIFGNDYSGCSKVLNVHGEVNSFYILISDGEKEYNGIRQSCLLVQGEQSALAQHGLKS